MCAGRFTLFRRCGCIQQRSFQKAKTVFCKLKKASFKTETIVVPLKNNFTNEYYYKFYFSSSMILYNSLKFPTQINR